MAEQNKPQGLGFALLIAAAILAIGVLVLSLRVLWQAARPPGRTATSDAPAQPEAIAAPSFNHTFEAPPATTPEPEQPRQKPDFEFDPETIMVRQELSRQQAQAFRTILREQTNLSFRLTEEEIQEMEREGVRVE